MSSEIFYDKAFIKVRDAYIPVVNHGSSNCFDFDFRGREIPEKHWSVLNYSYGGRMIFSSEEIQKLADIYETFSMDNQGGTRKSRYRSFEEGEFRRWFLSGMKSAHTVEEYEQYGNKVVVIDYGSDKWKQHCVSTTDELIQKIEELSECRITVAFQNNRKVIHPPRRHPRTVTDFSVLPEFYVLSAESGYFVKRSSRRIWFAKNQKPTNSLVRKFRTEKAAQKYLLDNQKFFSKYAFQIECVQNKGDIV